MKLFQKKFHTVQSPLVTVSSNERNEHVLKFFAYIHFTDHQKDQMENAKSTSSQNELSSSSKDAPDANIGMECYLYVFDPV